LHGDASPYTSEENVEKIVEELEKWSHGSPLDVLKFDLGEIIFDIQENSPKEMTCTLCRRFLVKLASGLAEKKGAKALITGETSGRDFRNFNIEDSSTELPVLRPLIGFSEQEIRNRCEKLDGEYILKKDICKAKVEDIEIEDVDKIETYLDLDEIVKEKMGDLI
jgi:thiamine biosynthesis protein ThiI